MARTKRTDRNDDLNHANAREAAVATDSPAVSESPIHETAGNPSGGRDQSECQPCPENTSDDFDMAVRELAYSKWEAAGLPEGDGFDFWLEAEREIKARQHTSPPATE